MKPLVATKGMKEGSANEKFALRALPTFISRQRTMLTFEEGRPYPSIQCPDMELNYLREVGFICSKKQEAFGDSPDGICALLDKKESKHHYCGIEVKTMTSVSTIEVARGLAEEHHTFVSLSDIGERETSTTLFRQLVPSSAYRAQCLHHSAVLDTPYVLYVVAKGFRSAQGSIFYAVLLEFSPSLRRNYICALVPIRMAAFGWIGLHSSSIPTEYDGMLKEIHTSDLHSLCAYYNLGRALREKIRSKGAPLPPCRQLRPTALVFWNALKGGVDAFSKNLKTLDYSASKVSPVVSVVKRMLSAQVNNAGTVHRIGLALAQEILKEPSYFEQAKQEGYVKLRQKVSQQETFGHLIRCLAKEFIADNSIFSEGIIIRSSETVQSQSKLQVTRTVRHIERRVSKKLVDLEYYENECYPQV